MRMGEKIIFLMPDELSPGQGIFSYQPISDRGDFQTACRDKVIDSPGVISVGAGKLRSVFEQNKRQVAFNCPNRSPQNQKLGSFHVDLDESDPRSSAKNVV